MSEEFVAVVLTLLAPQVDSSVEILLQNWTLLFGESLLWLWCGFVAVKFGFIFSLGDLIVASVM